VRLSAIERHRAAIERAGVVSPGRFQQGRGAGSLPSGAMWPHLGNVDRVAIPIKSSPALRSSAHLICHMNEHGFM
jgi:hypothetical protein